MLLLTIFLGSTLATAQEPRQVIPLPVGFGTLTIFGPSPLALADNVTVEWTLASDRMPSVSWDPIGPSPHWTVLENSPARIESTASGYRVDKRITFAPAALGELSLALPKLKIRVENEAWKETTPPITTWLVKSPIGDPQKETLRDITGIEATADDFKPDTSFPIGPMATVVAVGLMLAWIWRRRRTAMPATAEQRALQELAQLDRRGRLQTKNGRPFAYLLHRIVRRYLTAKWAMQADHCTTAELSEVIQADSRLREEDRKFLVELLSDLDRAKYSPTGLSPEERRTHADTFRSWLRPTKERSA